MDRSELIPYLVTWAVVIALVIRSNWKSAGAGLMMAYACQMIMLYGVGGLIHAFPWGDFSESLFGSEAIHLGFQQSTYAIAAFGAGSLILGPMVLGSMRKSRRQIPDTRLPRAYILYGMASYFVMAPTLGRVGGFQAIGAVGSQLVVVGCCLNCWKAWQTGGRRKLFLTLVPALVIPCVTVVFQGFLGFGVMAMLTILTFCAQFFRPRWILLAGFAISMYVGLSVYVTYMQARVQLRASVWGGESLSDRINTFLDSAGGFEWFDAWNEQHLLLIDERLNQNGLVGASVVYLENTGDYARGDTIVEALIGMVPRLMWPDKPVIAGSNGMATRFTGIEFAAGTSVGIGPVMELYANFGTPAVVVGFLLMGLLIKVVDVSAGVCLINGDWQGFAARCLVGISLVNVSGSFVECTMGAAASLVLGIAVNKALKRFTRKQAAPRREKAPVAAGA